MHAGYLKQRFKVSSRLAAVAVALIGALVMAGWLFAVPALTRFGPLTSMAFTTSVAFVLMGIVLAFVGLPEAPRRWQALSVGCCGMIVLGLGVTVLAEYEFNATGGLHSFPQVSWEAGTTGVSPVTAANFVLLGLALLMSNSRRLLRVGQYLALTAGFLGLLGVIGYAYDVQALYHVPSYAAMALPTTVAFCLISLAYLFARPDVGWMALMVSDSPSGRLARRLLPVAILLPALLGLFRLWGQAHGYYPAAFGTALHSLAMIVILTTVLIANLRRLHASDTERTLAEARLQVEVADLKNTEFALRRSEERYRTLFNAIDEGFCIIEMIFDEHQYPVDYRLLEVNPAFEKQTGLRHAEGKRMREMVPQHESYWFETYGRIALTGQPVRFQNRAEKLHRFFDVYAFRVGRPEERHVAVLFNDITERKRTEARLAEMNAGLEKLVLERTASLQETVNELEHFSYTITHDMRAPLRAMRGFGTILLEEFGKTLHGAGQDLLRRITDAAARMDHLITDALKYSRAVQTQLQLKPVSPAPLLSGLLESYPQFHPPHAQIEIQEPLPSVLANEAGMIQCFSNLLDNAVKFVAPGVTPRVRVWAETVPQVGGGLRNETGEPRATSPIPSHPPNAMVRFWIEDNGIGIDPNHQDRIFVMFQKLDKSYQGTGIGLALVRKVVERMGGRVGVESMRGQGSRFWIELRSAEEGIAAARAAA